MNVIIDTVKCYKCGLHYCPATDNHDCEKLAEEKEMEEVRKKIVWMRRRKNEETTEEKDK